MEVILWPRQASASSNTEAASLDDIGWLIPGTSTPYNGNTYENLHLNAAAENADNQAPLYRVSGSGDFHWCRRFDSDLPIKAANGIIP
jgi:hypothetical protein